MLCGPGAHRSTTKKKELVRCLSASLEYVAQLINKYNPSIKLLSPVPGPSLSECRSRVPLNHQPRDVLGGAQRRLTRSRVAARVFGPLR